MHLGELEFEASWRCQAAEYAKLKCGQDIWVLSINLGIIRPYRVTEMRVGEIILGMYIDENCC